MSSGTDLACRSVGLRDAPDLLVAAAVHPATGDATGAPMPMPDSATTGSPPSILHTLAQAHLRADVVLRRHGRVTAPIATLFTGPAASWRVEHRDTGPAVAFPMTAHVHRDQLRTTIGDIRHTPADHHE